LLSDTMKKAIAKKLRIGGRVIFAGMYLLLGAELFLRIFAPVPMLPRYVCATDYGIRGNEPDRNYWHITPEYRINISTNSKGIRCNEEIPYEKPEGTKRIVVLGDSFGMGYGVDLEDTFTNQMENSLISAGIKCEVINLSVSGHGNAEEIIALKEEGFKYQPDLVLLAWHRTDYQDNPRSNLFALEDGKLVRKSMTYLPGVKIRQRLFKYAGYRFLAGKSHLYNFLREFTSYRVKKILVALNQSDTKNKKDDADTNESLQTYYRDLTIALFNEIKDQSRQHQSEFMFLGIPSKKSRTEFESTFPMTEAQYRGVFNLYCPIKDFQKYKGQTLYWERSHGHFTPLGCRVVGQGLAKFIVEHDLLNCLK